MGNLIHDNTVTQSQSQPRGYAAKQQQLKGEKISHHKKDGLGERGFHHQIRENKT